MKTVSPCSLPVSESITNVGTEIQDPVGEEFRVITDAVRRLARNEDEVAAILAHEMSHVIRGHGINAIRKARWRDGKQVLRLRGRGADPLGLVEVVDSASGNVLGTLQLHLRFRPAATPLALGTGR